MNRTLTIAPTVARLLQVEGLLGHPGSHETSFPLTVESAYGFGADE